MSGSGLNANLNEARVWRPSTRQWEPGGLAHFALDDGCELAAGKPFGQGPQAFQGPALKTKRTWRAATASPQPVMELAAIPASSSRRRDASSEVKPSRRREGATSRLPDG